MNCIQCMKKSCRSAVSCGIEKTPAAKVADRYHAPYEQQLVQAAAELVDGGRAGTLSRIEEIAEFADFMGYTKLGLAYCYGIEEEAALVKKFLDSRGFRITAVCCTVGGMAQNSINDNSSIESVSCNPIMQAEQLNKMSVELVVTMGLCLGHDILLNRYLQVDSTNLVVKDRTNGHNPLKAIRGLADG